MIKTLKLPMIFLFLASTTFGQVGIINDSDGFSNIREKPDIESKIIYKIQDCELFLYEIDNKSEWIKVFVPKNKYALDCNESNYLIGYMHKSRLKPIEELEKYVGENFSFKYNLVTFNLSNKIVDYIDGKWISKINGRPYYGTDGNVPKNEILSIDIRVKGNQILVPHILYQDLFELTNNFNIYRKNDIYFVHQWNSDGAGGYLIVWTIDKYSIKQRLILKP